MCKFKDSTETSCDKCNSKAFGENLTHDPANLVRRSANWAAKAVAESLSQMSSCIYMYVNDGSAGEVSSLRNLSYIDDYLVL